MSVEKIDGLDGVWATRARYITINAYADDGAAVTYTRGDAMAIETNLSGGYEITVAGVATNAATYLGIGNMATKLASGGTSHDSLGFGIIAETVTIAAGAWQPVSVQVGGIAFCNVEASVAAGDRLNLSSTAGRLELMATEDYDLTHALAVALEADGTSGSLDGTQAAATNYTNAYLLNPLNF